MTVLLEIMAPSGIPEAILLARVIMSGSIPKCSRANIFPVRPHSRLHLVRYVEDFMAVTQGSNFTVKIDGRDHVSPFSLDRFHKNGRDFLGRDDPSEKILLNPFDAEGAAGIRCQIVGTPVSVSIGHVGDTRYQRGETFSWMALLAVRDRAPMVRS